MHSRMRVDLAILCSIDTTSSMVIHLPNVVVSQKTAEGIYEFGRVCSCF